MKQVIEPQKKFLKKHARQEDLRPDDYNKS